ncbi:MAG: ester cyclase [Anaerolineae bacterium]|nr:ester cyclase [Anaerolineae bacterium]
MSVEVNKEVVRKWFGQIVNGQTDIHTLFTVLEATFAPEFVDHDGPDPKNGRQVLKRTLPGLLNACPDAHFTIEQLIGEGDMVAVRLRGEATRRGEIGGAMPIGKHITWSENELMRFDNGRIVESWGEGTLDQALAEIGLSFKFG